MIKKIILVLVVTFFTLTIVSVYSIEPTNTIKTKVLKTRTLSSSNWVHPNLRESYKGYTKLKEQQQYSKMWQYSTNRQSGNIKGGGTTKYSDYPPSNHSSKKTK